jgi:hypothetical protein
MATYVTNFADIADGIGSDELATGRSMSAFLGNIVAAASLEEPQARIRLPLGCRRRPNHRPCPGQILVDALAMPNRVAMLRMRLHRRHHQLEEQLVRLVLSGQGQHRSHRATPA